MRQIQAAIAIAIAMATFVVVPAFSDDSTTLANHLGAVLAAEEFCDLSYDQAAVSAYIESNVAADDMSFRSTLSLMTDGHGYSQQSMSGSAKTAHCTQVARLAKANHFTH